MSKKILIRKLSRVVNNSTYIIVKLQKIMWIVYPSTSWLYVDELYLLQRGFIFNSNIYYCQATKIMWLVFRSTSWLHVCLSIDELYFLQRGFIFNCCKVMTILEYDIWSRMRISILKILKKKRQTLPWQCE